jgi:hypothetical protein
MIEWSYLTYPKLYCIFFFRRALCMLDKHFTTWTTSASPFVCIFFFFLGWVSLTLPRLALNSRFPASAFQVVNNRISLFWGRIVFDHTLSVCLSVYHIFFNHSSVDGHLGSFITWLLGLDFTKHGRVFKSFVIPRSVITGSISDLY